MICHLSTTALTKRCDLAHKISLKPPPMGHDKQMAPEAMGMAFA
jgi:hypothetical protein